MIVITGDGLPADLIVTGLKAESLAHFHANHRLGGGTLVLLRFSFEDHATGDRDTQDAASAAQKSGPSRRKHERGARIVSAKTALDRSSPIRQGAALGALR